MHKIAVLGARTALLSLLAHRYLLRMTCYRLLSSMLFLTIGHATAGTNMYFGSGIVSIIGPAFAYIPVITASLGKMMAEGQSFDHAWGRMAGTIMAVAPIQARTLLTT